MNNIIGEGRFDNRRKDVTQASSDIDKSWVEGEAAIDHILRILQELETINQNGSNHEAYRRIINLVAELRGDGRPESEVRARLDQEIARHAILLDHIRNNSLPRVSDLPPHEPPYGGTF